MAIALVGSEKYPRSADARRPAIDTSGAVVLGDEDGVSPARFGVRGVAPFNQRGGRELSEFNSFSHGAEANLSWTITVTDCRVVFSAPEVTGPYGGIKTKSGRMSAGQFRYEWLSDIAWGFGNLWLLTPLTKSGNRDRVGLTWEEALCSELARCLVGYWQRRGRVTGQLEGALRVLVDERGIPSGSLNIDLLLKNDGEASGPVSAAPEWHP